MSWFYPAGSLKTETTKTTITPKTANWDFCGLDVFSFDQSKSFEVELNHKEGVLLSLSAQNFKVKVDGVEFTLKGRAGVFTQVSDWIYLPVNSKIELTGSTGEVALCLAKASKILPVQYIKAEDVAVEVRGSGRATRQVTNYATPGQFDEADKIIVCEVLTPGGNLSSWPPHRHDGVVDETVTVRDEDVYLVPEGYHGPSTAYPEYPMYFLNVMAGPAEDRVMSFCDDPKHHWIRQSWETQTQDPRCPMTSATGRVNK
jgi:5-deoxy-glucuronate isomerase